MLGYRLSKETYISPGHALEERNRNTFLSYHKLQDAKNDCHPVGIDATDRSSEVEL